MITGGIMRNLLVKQRHLTSHETLGLPDDGPLIVAASVAQWVAGPDSGPVVVVRGRQQRSGWRRVEG